MRSGVIPCLLMLGACLPQEKAHFPEGDYALSFFIRAPALNEEPIEITRIEGRELTWAAGAQETLWFLGITTKDLEHTHPGAAEIIERTGQVSLELLQPGCPDEEYDDENMLRLPINNPTALLVLDPASQSFVAADADARTQLRSHFALVLPACLAGGGLKSFGAAPHYIPDGTVLEGKPRHHRQEEDGFLRAEGISHLDQEHVIVLTPSMIYIARSGSIFDESTTRFIITDDPRLTDRSFRAMFLHEQRLWVVIGMEMKSQIVQFGVSTSTITLEWVGSEFDTMLRDLIITEDDLIIAVGDHGDIIWGTSTATLDRLEIGQTDLLAVEETRQAQAPHFIGSREGELFVGDVRTASFNRTVPETDPFFINKRFEALGVRAQETHAELYASSAVGRTYTSKDSGINWDLLPIHLPACTTSSDDCGHGSTTLSIKALSVSAASDSSRFGRRMFFYIDHCPTPLLFYEDLSCVTPLADPPFELTRYAPFTVADHYQGSVAMAGEDGLIHEYSLAQE